MVVNSRRFGNHRNKSRGVGRRATEASTTLLGPLNGQRYVVLGDPRSAVEVCIGRLISEGFILRPDDLEQALRKQNTPWTARTVEIGDAGLAKRLWWKNLVLFDEDDPDLSLIWRGAMRRGIAPTMVVVAARPEADGRSELVISPVKSGRGPRHDAGAAEPRLSRVLTAVASDLYASGRLVHAAEPFIELDDPTCPAHRTVLPTLITWP